MSSLGPSDSLLVVDDEHDILHALRSALEDEGYDVVAVDSGRAALEYLGRTRPRLVLMDVMMPFVSGVEVLRRLRSEPDLASLPVVLMSAAPLTTAELPEHEEFLRKPFSLERLLDVVGRIAPPPSPSSTSV